MAKGRGRGSLIRIARKTVGIPEHNYKALEELMDEIWEDVLQTSPELATMLGYHKYDGQVSEVGVEAEKRKRETAVKFMTKLLDKFPKSLEEHRAKTWTLDQRVTLSIVEYRLQKVIKEHDMKLYMWCMDSMRSPLSMWPQLIAKMNFKTTSDFELYRDRISKIPAQLEQYCILLQTGLKHKVTPPRVAVEPLIAQAFKLVASVPSPFHKVVDDNFSASGAPVRLRAEIEELIDTQLLPAFTRLGEFLDTQYVPYLSTEISVTKRCANGDELYEALVESYTTTNLTAKEIHKIGLGEVDRIMRTMKKIAKSQGFHSVNEYQEHLDANFYYKTEEELLDYYMTVAMKIAPKLPTVIGKLPRTPFGIKAIPEYMAASAPAAYYERPPNDLSRAGFFSLNTHKPETRKTYISNALVLHEGCPGHHLQLSLSAENGNVHPLRKNTHFTALVEGWGLYCEYLGHEMGMYEKPEQHYGRLVIEMMRACRLVVDTGMNGDLGWTKDGSMEYMLKKNAGSPGDLDSETTRYVAMPGQALSYKIGEIKIKELRARAEEALGDSFDLRKFHDLILELGAVPLSTLDELVQDWINGHILAVSRK